MKQDTRSQTHSDLDSCKLVVFLGVSKPRTSYSVGQKEEAPTMAQVGLAKNVSP